MPRECMEWTRFDPPSPSSEYNNGGEFLSARKMLLKTMVSRGLDGSRMISTPLFLSETQRRNNQLLPDCFGLTELFEYSPYFGLLQELHRVRENRNGACGIMANAALACMHNNGPAIDLYPGLNMEDVPRDFRKAIEHNANFSDQPIPTPQARIAQGWRKKGLLTSDRLLKFKNEEALRHFILKSQTDNFPMGLKAAYVLEGIDGITIAHWFAVVLCRKPNQEDHVLLGGDFDLIGFPNDGFVAMPISGFLRSVCNALNKPIGFRVTEGVSGTHMAGGYLRNNLGTTRLKRGTIGWDPARRFEYLTEELQKTGYARVIGLPVRGVSDLTYEEKKSLRARRYRVPGTNHSLDLSEP